MITLHKRNVPIRNLIEDILEIMSSGIKIYIIIKIFEKKNVHLAHFLQFKFVDFYGDSFIFEMFSSTLRDRSIPNRLKPFLTLIDGFV